MRMTKGIVSPVGLAALDGTCVAAAMVAAYYLRVEGSVFPYSGPQDIATYAVIAAIMVPVWVGTHFAARLYDSDVVGSGMDEYAQILKASTFSVVAMMVLSFWDRGLLLSRGWVLISWLLSVTFLALGRLFVRRLMLRRRQRGQGCVRAIVVGTNHRAIGIARQLHRDPGAGTAVAGFLDDTLSAGNKVLNDLAVWGSPADLVQAVRALDATEVFVIPEALDWETYQDVVHQAAMLPSAVRVRICPRLDQLLSSGVRLTKKADVPILTLAGLSIDPRAAVLKRATDCVLAFILLVVSAPILGVISALLRCFGGSPVFDRYRAIGLHGASFTAFKFHTGLLGATRRTYALPARATPDSRIRCSTFGSFLYRYGLDKLPQLWNVFKGDMSLVGPRVSTLKEREMVSNWLPSISNLRPGLTGPWALSNAANLNEEMEVTLYYVRNWDFARDIMIILRTALNVLKTRPVVSGYVPTMPIVTSLPTMSLVALDRAVRHPVAATQEIPS